MFARWSKLFAVFSLVLSLGFHWAFLQTVAWIGMGVSYSHHDSIATALIKTFDGKNPCQLCKFVNEGKKSDHKSDNNFSVKKPETYLNQAVYFHFSPQQYPSTRFVLFITTRVEAPPIRPPISA